MADFQNKVAIISGGAGGIGGGVAREMARLGARVAVADVDGAAAKELAGQLGGVGVAMDVRDEASVDAAVDEIVGQLGVPDYLFNVVGIVGGHGELFDLPTDVWDTTMSVNTRGMYLVSKAVVARMRAEARAGAIVNVGSIGGIKPGGPLAHYGISKAAVHALTIAAAKQLAPHGIRVNAVAPGPVYTPMTKEGMDDPQSRAAWESRIPIGHIAAVEDIVPLMIHLASDDARNITGAIVETAGGLGL